MSQRNVIKAKKDQESDMAGILTLLDKNVLGIRGNPR
jgi:hypothetical protein